MDKIYGIYQNLKGKLEMREENWLIKIEAAFLKVMLMTFQHTHSQSRGRVVILVIFVCWLANGWDLGCPQESNSHFIVFC